MAAKKQRHSLQKGYRILSFAKKEFGEKCSKKLLNTANKTETDNIKTTSERVISEITSDLIGNRTVDKITSKFKKDEFHHKNLTNYQ